MPVDWIAFLRELIPTAPAAAVLTLGAVYLLLIAIDKGTALYRQVQTGKSSERDWRRQEDEDRRKELRRAYDTIESLQLANRDLVREVQNLAMEVSSERIRRGEERSGREMAEHNLSYMVAYLREHGSDETNRLLDTLPVVLRIEEAGGSMETIAEEIAFIRDES